MNELINQYIEDKKFAWSPTTIKSERARLNSVIHLLDGNPEHLWLNIQYLRPYSRLTLWTRTVDYWTFVKPNEVNPYETFRKKNSRLFKHVYQPKEVGLSFEEAVEAIKKISNTNDRTRAFQILSSGERYSEAVQKGNNVVGKGSKVRSVFRLPDSKATSSRSYSSLRRSLASVGLRIHSLRKLCATRLVKEGMNEADLMKVMGWSSILTAKAYLQPKKDEQIKNIFSKIHKELENA